jgi:micrococcal nuclease
MMIGLLVGIVSVGKLFKNAKGVKGSRSLYWPFAGTVFGIAVVLAKAGFGSDWMNFFACISFIFFFIFLMTGIVSIIRRKRNWKRFSGVSVILFIAFMIFVVNVPKTNTTSASPVDTKDSSHQLAAVSTKENDHAKQSKKAAQKEETKKAVHKTAAALVTTKSKTDHQSSSSSTQKKSKSESKANQVPVTLVETVDGDTIKVNYNGKVTTVRYLLVDTSEEKKPGVCVQPYAVDAYNKNKQMLNSGNITLEFDHGSRYDKYGRLLAYVFVNGHSVQEELLKDGYARVAYIYDPPYKYLSQYQADENIAKAKKLNIWSRPGFVTDRGFNGCVAKTANTATAHPATTTHSAAHKSTQTQTDPNTSTGSGTEFFKNCTELRMKYPNGVSKSSPAYQAKMDRDKDGWACERY